ncbi:UDP-N-acetylmuramate:L-alanine ligase [Rubrivivax sp. A210]|uniref:UDP-N-acetylmuramate--L-alanine ligase n=1 Tax=Rubrivivax sp. A210 TaxID=2772301 RepID=UPI00191B7C60|nr:UDP-N-acetylmuramate--L-alanine ligase [Rubrivivax sp. A210]CAD5370519.1 UDP-N-acetylmuramate:L-alanine ligase [Rubrivivax sp. A210]
MKPFVSRIHFVGIGGAGMSGIAEILHQQGLEVSGSDQAESAVTRRLAGLGLAIHIGHDAAHVGEAQAVVTSTAVKADNPEVLAAHARGLPVVARAVVLAELMRRQQGIAIAGTHGKTTTTSLVASVLIEAGLDPSFVIGGKLESAGVNARLGSGEFIVVEADESDASFLHLHPVLAVVTNIDADHMETYGHDVARLHGAFVDFLARLPFYGRAIVCSDDPGVRAVLPQLAQRGIACIRYGIDDDQADLRATEVQALAGGGMRFVVRRRDAQALPLTLNLAGAHNVRNALAAVAIAGLLGIADAPLQRALAAFAGVGRRFQRHGEWPAVGGGHFTLIDDYGHHPVEMAAVLAAARGAFVGRRIVLAFQPHRYSRTRDCLADFAAVLGQCDAALVTEVYAAGETPIAGADGRALVAAVAAVQGPVAPVFVDDVAALAGEIVRVARGGDVVITMGAGSIAGVPRQLAQLLESQA